MEGTTETMEVKCPKCGAMIQVSPGKVLGTLLGKLNKGCRKQISEQDRQRRREHMQRLNAARAKKAEEFGLT